MEFACCDAELELACIEERQEWRKGLFRSSKFCAVLLLAACTCLAVFNTGVQGEELVSSFQENVQPILTRYCVRCHDADVTKGDLRVDRLTAKFDATQIETWHDVLDRVATGEMPPQDAEELPTLQRRKLLAWIRKKLDAIESEGEPRGHAVVRRLTRYEYSNTLRDLTGIALDYSVDLPPDSISRNGFKNNGAALGISALQMEYYVRAARRAMEKAIVTGPAPPVHRHRFESSSASNAPKNKSPIGNRMEPGGQFFGKMLEYPREGEFVIRVKAGAVVPEGQGFPRMQIKLGLRSDTVSPTRMLGTVDVSNPEQSLQIYEFRGRIEEFPLPGKNPKFPGVTIAVSNAYDDGLPAERVVKYPLVKLSRDETKLVQSRIKERVLRLPKQQKAGTYNEKSGRDFNKTVRALQKHIEELRFVDRESEADIDVACRLFEIDTLQKKLDRQLKQLCKENEIDHVEWLQRFESDNADQLNDNASVIQKFKHLTPLNPRDKDAISALLPPGPPRSTLVLEWLEFEGPLFDKWPPENHRNLLPELHDTAGVHTGKTLDSSPANEQRRARQAIKRFMKRAFRRPVTSADVTYVMDYYAEVRQRSESFEEAMREAFVMILISPEFLYQIQPRHASEAQRLTPQEFATRLSYFLWATMPDAELTSLADSGKLLETKVVEDQVRRLLRSRKSSQFVTHFTDQWLDVSGIDRVAVNPEYYPDFDNELKASMQGETRAFFGELLNHDLSALNLIDSDFVMVDAALAQHYGVKGPRGSTFERVNLAGDSRRGGLLTQASVLLLNSTGEDSHPIRRGVWLRSRLLGDPPAPPPPDVPDLDTQSDEAVLLSVREQLERHRNREACNDCHRGIDPWGIPFENFDAIGKFRNDAVRLGSKKGKKVSVAVSSHSVLPNGVKIQDISDLKAYLLERERRRFATTLVSRLVEYGTGRAIGFEDRKQIEMLTDTFEAEDYRLSDLIVAIVQSSLFQNN
jgi:hypothetical protein